FRSRAGRIAARALVDGQLVCEATLTCAVVTREREQRAHGDKSAGEPATSDGVAVEAGPQ
ncbi:MAG: hypothetical protein WBE41_22650, partial [Terracidiphilus sp.]